MVDRYGYTYDSLGNRLSKDVPTTVNALNDQDYTMAFDGLNRMVGYREGTLSQASIIKLKQEQEWGLDILGNWSTFDDEDLEGDSNNNLSNQNIGLSPMILLSLRRYSAVLVESITCCIASK